MHSRVSRREFTFKEFHTFCESHEIHYPLTTSRSSKQNGIAKRKNRTILTMARSILKAKSMSKEFWVEAIACVVYLSNKFPIISVQDKIP